MPYISHICINLLILIICQELWSIIEATWYIISTNICSPMRWHSLVCVKTLVFWGYLNTLNSSRLLPTNWNKRRPNIFGTRMPSSPLSVYHQLFTQCIWKKSPQLFNINQLWSTSLSLQIISCLMVIAIYVQLMVVHTGRQQCISHPFHSFLFPPVGVSAVPEISAVPQKSDYQGDKTHQETTHFAK